MNDDKNKGSNKNKYLIIFICKKKGKCIKIKFSNIL